MRHHPVPALAGFVLLATWNITVQAANPTDPGNPSLYSPQIYVDNTASTACVSTAPGACGSAAKPFTSLPAALAVLKPGAELIIAGNGKPYRGTVDGKLPASGTLARSVMALSALNEGPAQKHTLVRKWAGTGNPTIRGSLVVDNNWIRVLTKGYVYKRTWSAVSSAWPTDPVSGQPHVLEPQQVFHGTTSLQQVGGKVFRTYSYPSPVGSDYAAIEQELGGKTLWPGRITPAATKPWAALAVNQFYHDAPDKTLYVKLAAPMDKGLMEVSVYQHVLMGAEYPRNIDNVTVRDLVIERNTATSFARGAAVQLMGRNIRLESLTVREADATCVSLVGMDNAVTQSTLERCGQSGLAGHGARITVSNNIVRYNNTRGFETDWEAGGIKFIGGKELQAAQASLSLPNPLPAMEGMDQGTFSRNRVYNNQGHGIWLDTHNDDNVVDGNVVAYNLIGLFLEINARNLVQNNQVFGNRGQGMQVKESDSRILNNWVIGNSGFGIVTPHDSRTILPTDTTFAPYRNTFTGNRLAWNNTGTGAQELAMSLVVDPAQPVVNSLTVSGNQYCARFTQNALKKLVPGDTVLATSKPAYTLAEWNTQLAQFGTGPDRSEVANYAFPTTLVADMAARSESLVLTAFTGNVLSSSQQAACQFSM
jgi:parallel beta-helix repeat protein